MLSVLILLLVLLLLLLIISHSRFRDHVPRRRVRGPGLPPLVKPGRDAPLHSTANRPGSQRIIWRAIGGLFPTTSLFRRAADGDRPRSALRHPHHAKQLPVCRPRAHAAPRSEEHTSELQSHHDLVCRLLLEKKKKN